MFLGIDIGGTTIKYGVFDSKGECINKYMINTAPNVDKFYVNLFDIINTMRQQYTIKGIGISAPGVINEDGFMVTAGAIDYLYGHNLKSTIESKIGLPVVIENDANCAAIAEKWIGNASSYNHYIFIVLGTGVGGGIIINNKIYRGAHGSSGEFGWIINDNVIDKEDIEDLSFNHQVSVVNGLIKIYNNLISDTEHTAINNAKEIFELYNQNDTLAQKAIHIYFSNLSILILDLVSCFDPQAIIIGGGISENEQFNSLLQEYYTSIREKHNSLRYLNTKFSTPIIAAKLKNDAGMIGAVYLVKENISV